MRFGRKNKNRHHLASQAKTRDSAIPSESVESEEGGGLLETQVQQSVAVASEYSNDGESTEPTQQLLTALGCFQRQLTDAHSASSSGPWSEECMNQLITAVDVALTQEWMSIVEALTDTGRILQTYKNADRAQDSLPFLNDAYEVLCLMVGDLIVDNDSDALVTNWRKLYGGAVRAVEDTGLVLARDDDTGNEPSLDSDTTLEIRLPEGMVESIGAESSGPDELPMLDELSPLDGPNDEAFAIPSVETSEPDTSPEELGDTELASADEIFLDSKEPKEIVPEVLEDTIELEDVEVEEVAEIPVIEVSVELDDDPSQNSSDVLEIEELADESIVEIPAELDEGPPEILGGVQEIEELADPPAKKTPAVVVEIMDRISEQLSVLQDASGETRDFALERLQGGIGALTRAAKDDGHVVAERLSALMDNVCALSAQTDEKAMGRMIELGFAFCGTYMEAAEQGETASVLDWQSECQALLDECKEDASSDALLVEGGPESEMADTQDGGITEIVEINKQDTPVSEIEKSDEISEEWMLLEPDHGATTATTEEAVAAASPESTLESSPAEDSQTSEEPVPTTKYVELLASAQEAALKGDRAAAQYFALQAAAHIAHTDVENAEEHLGQTEGRLKDSLGAAKTASNEVKEAESRAREISTEVVSAENSLGEVKQIEAEVTQEVQDIQSVVDDLDKQIRDLEARRSEEIEKCKQAQERLSDAENTTEQSQLELDGTKKSEEDSRNYLERCRQHVKDEQEITAKIEMEVQEAREHLAQRERSSGEIDDTIGKTCGDEPPTPAGEKTDSTLF